MMQAACQFRRSVRVGYGFWESQVRCRPRSTSAGRIIMTERRHVLDRMDMSRPLLRLELSTRGVLVLAAVVIAIWLISHLWSIFVLVIISLMIATSLMPFVDWLMTRGLSRRKAVATICALFFLIVGTLGFLVVPSAVNQARDIAN